MKVKMSADSKKVITLAKLGAAKEVIRYMREGEEDSTPKWYAEIAARVATNGGYVSEVLKAEAEITTNCRVWNAYGKGTEDVDVWVDTTAFVSANDGEEFVKIGFYISDMWQVTGQNNEEIAAHMYIRRFKEAE